MNKCVLVTGGSRGIGKGIVFEFAKNGYDVIINYNNRVEEANNVLEKIKAWGANGMIVKCDVSDEEQVKNMIEQIKNVYGHLDVLVNNAGIANDGVFLDKTKDDFLRVYGVNLVGPFLCSKYASKIMTPNSSIVNISSTNGIDTYYTYSADYDASKAALNSLTNNLAIELSPIRVNAVAPGWVMTDMNRELGEDYIQSESEKILLKRFGNIEEIAKAVVFLSSSDASYINKVVLRVDGGYYNV